MSESANHTVSEEQVLQVAALASLELTPEEVPVMRRDLNAVLGYIAQLNEVDVTGIAPMAQVSEILPASQKDEPAAAATPAETPLRPDAAVPSLDHATVMRSAPETDGTFFKVPQVIGR